MLHRHQERFIGGEPRVDQDRYLLAQMVFQLRYIGGVDRLPATEVAPPSVDLPSSETASPGAAIAQAPCSGVADTGWPAGTERESAPQMSRSVASTTCHCLRSSAS